MTNDAEKIEVKTDGVQMPDIHPSGEVRTNSNMRDMGQGILRQTDLDDFTEVDPVTGLRTIKKGSDHDSFRDAYGDPITDGGM